MAYNHTLTFNPGYGPWRDIDNDGVTIRSSSTGAEWFWARTGRAGCSAA